MVSNFQGPSKTSKVLLFPMPKSAYFGFFRFHPNQEASFLSV